MSSTRTRIHWVNWKSDFDIESLGKDIAELSDGAVRLYEVNTGSEDRVFILADGELTPDQVDQAFNDDAEGGPQA